ncbi:GNAT family N-acetyltransferase [Pseudomonas moraviensis]|uniref:GNAT family N-acetyltransferase n=1 Tax=Pseudomonas moraviensis TaxID=321662 RepID=A0A2A2PTB4_9PSED|nr:GNAT family N-acetyltransferase [Pseudomonas moraviensis]PAW48987.1 GNAT family N-acetyltransferase [Pseudomonas moraviensis]PAW58714.1 GNAT family N-acetyltransferase [Pseudomonas moraviensis]
MTYQLRRAELADRVFARELTCQNMLRYYIGHDLLWQDQAFEVAWDGRDNWLIILGQIPVGFFSLSRDRRALYIRELQIVEAFRGQGAGSWAIDQVIAIARSEGLPALRLTVFKNNPAQSLYKRKGLNVCGEDECFLRMQLDFGTPVL